MAKKTGSDFNPKWLDGLRFSTSRAETVKTENGDKTRWVPERRPLTEAEVLCIAHTDAEVVIVAADGKKHRVKK